ncbi:MAG: cardiolipin synthase, partial [Bradyrhizobium icense]
SGVEVHVMIPNKPDHPFIYQATLSYAEQLVEYGAHVHIYDGGFLHAKTIIVDDEMLSIGTANFDIRSFKLNFEVNTFMYSEKLAQAYHAQYMSDLQHAYELTPDIIANYSLWERFKQQFSRLFSPIL